MSQPKPLASRPFLSAVSTSGSSDALSPLSTPRAKMLGDHFQSEERRSSDTSRPNRPSPPKKADMPMDQVHARMRWLGVHPPTYKEKYPRCYDKLCYAIAHDLDLHFPKFRGPLYARRILNKKCPMGKQFHALYSADGDELSTKTEARSKGIQTFGFYVSHHLDEYKEKNTVDVYVVFHDPKHPNMEPFYRLQTYGNCFIQAPILVHWYAQLWYSPDKSADDVDLIHLSRYLRNSKSGKDLYHIVVNDEGGKSEQELENLAGHRYWQISYSENSFESIREKLEKYGPAMVVMERTHLDFHDEGFRYEGTPSGKWDGHAMVLVGIRKDDSNQVFFLMQNFWKEKQFVEIRQDYLVASTERQSQPVFTFLERGIVERANYRQYSQKTESIRMAQSSPRLERACQIRPPSLQR